jgi:DNA (cytosine-5)-methyltransferase 1
MLHAAAKQWQTPATDSFRSRGGDRKDEMGLDQQARHWPTARTITGGAESGKRKKELGRMASGGGDLQAAAVVFPLSRPVPTISQAGKPSSNGTRKLNPLFVEWLMGFPLGWTDSAPLATASFRSWLLTHTALFEALYPRAAAESEAA